MEKIGLQGLLRRSFLTKVGKGMTMFGAMAGTGLGRLVLQASVPPAQSGESGRWQAARHAQDDWFDKIPGQHRLVFDTTAPNGMSSALLYGSNYYQANMSDYGLQNSDLAVVIIARHTSTPYAYNEQIWAKYGVQLSNFIDKTKEPSKTNTYARQLNGLLNRGANLAVCQMATSAIAGMIARDAGAMPDEILKEIAANLLPNSHLVPAGIVAVNRAQERGYTLVHAV